MEKREGKGIWENLYQFPLVETNKDMDFDDFNEVVKNVDLLKNIDYHLSLFNSEAIVHKLSHQHLYSKFWIVKTDALLPNTIAIETVKEYPVPILIGNFIESFYF